MALQLGINSYVSVTEANNYFEDRVNTDSWDTSNIQSEALVTATNILDRLQWIGTSNSFANATYKLAWPRTTTFTDPSSGVSQSLTDNRTTSSAGTIPQDIKDATCELAYHLIINTDLLNNTSTVQDLTVGSIRLLNSRKAPELPDTVIQIVSKYITGGLNFRVVFTGV